MKTKTCRQCEKTLPVSDFSRLRSRSDKRRGTCKSCERKKMKASSTAYDECGCGNLKRACSAQCRDCFLGTFRPQTEKRCCSCGETKPITNFGIRPSPTGPKVRSRCTICESRDAKARRGGWSDERRESHLKTRADWRRRTPLKQKRTTMRRTMRKWGWDNDTIREVISQYEQSLRFCEICGRHESECGTLHVDHCHKSNVFRGFLCSTCNTGLGMFRESTDLLKLAASYLENHGKAD